MAMKKASVQFGRSGMEFHGHIAHLVVSTHVVIISNKFPVHFPIVAAVRYSVIVTMMLIARTMALVTHVRVQALIAFKIVVQHARA